MQRIRHILEYIFVLGLIGIIRLFGKTKINPLAKVLSAILFLFPKHRKKAMENLKTSFPKLPSEKVGEIAKKCYQNFVLSTLEFIEIDRFSKEEIEEKVEVYGLSHLEKAVSEGKGVIMATVHLGNWEMMGRTLTSKGYKLNVIARKQRNELVEGLIKERREKAGFGVIYSESTKQDVLKALLSKEIVAILIDQDAGRNGVFVDFFDRPASTTPSPIIFSLRTGAPIIPFYNIRLEDGSYKVIIEEPFLFKKTGDIKKDIALNLEALTKKFEEVIRKDPKQWFWLHNRWATQPSNGN
ncbi:MAG: lysophospholipid acyltransferase family protein [bacterium]|nr:lysophospholipid acyltransferase family protein [bacterium]